jgi:uncharacterized phiE125 gp8 family phage protein
MGIKVITAASNWIPLAELRLHLKQDTTNDDDLITDWLAGAVAVCEHATGRSFGEQTLEFAIDEFPSTVAIALPRGTVMSITSVKYIDTSSVEQTIDSGSYMLDDYSTPAFLIPAYGTDWPDTLETVNAVKVRYVAGSATIPAAVKNAIKLMVGHWDQNREAAANKDIRAIAFGVESLLSTVKDYSGVA